MAEQLTAAAWAQGLLTRRSLHMCVPSIRTSLYSTQNVYAFEAFKSIDCC